MQNIDTGVQNKHPNTELCAILHSYDDYFTMVPGTKKQKQLSDWRKKKPKKPPQTNNLFSLFSFVKLVTTCHSQRGQTCTITPSLV